MNIDYLRTLYDYNYWARDRLYPALDTLTAEQWDRRHGHSWESVHGILLHMLNSEWMWLRRWQGESPQQFMSAADYPTLAAVRARWAEIQADVLAGLGALTPAEAERVIRYTNTKGKQYAFPLWQILAHLANHGAHHRGELAAMLAAMNVPHPEDDFIRYFIEKSGQG